MKTSALEKKGAENSLFSTVNGLFLQKVGHSPPDSKLPGQSPRLPAVLLLTKMKQNACLIIIISKSKL